MEIMSEKPENAIVIADIEVLALKKLVLVNHALAQVMTDQIAGREQQTLTRVLSDIVIRAEIANTMAKCAKPPAMETEAERT